MRKIKIRLPNKNVELSGQSPVANIFDAKNGIGAVPYNQDVSYFGWVCLMKPSEFLKLAATLREGTSVQFIADSLEAGLQIGQPFFMVELDEENNTWQVKGHEGRNRCLAIKQVYGDVLIPVHLIPKGGLRARDITHEMKRFALIPEKGGSPIKFDDSRL